METTFNQIPTKYSVTKSDDSYMMIVRPQNGQQISYKTPLVSLSKFFIDANTINETISLLDSFVKTTTEMVNQIPTSDMVDAAFLSKERSSYYRDKLITKEVIQQLLSKYCTKHQLDMDIQNCMEHSRSVATALANSLATTATISKGIISRNTTSFAVGEMIAEAAAAGGEEPEE